ncbi:MAG: transcription antitermination factor NusB [Anaerolineales bacterium]|nr:MAG: transcription antitermination factor NusB [Anaerolineales bacterium]
MLYEVDCVDHQPQEVITRRLEDQQSLGEEALAFTQRLVAGALKFAPEIDRLIASCAPEWPVDELAVLDRNILRLAIWEFAIAGETPLKVAINEAVELAKRFSSDSAPRFINGVLGTLAQREEDIHRQFQPTGLG